MRFFKRLMAGVNVAPLIDEVNQQELLWLHNTSRQDKIQAQRDTNTIFLRGAVKRPDIHINENQSSYSTEVSKLFPLAMDLLNRFSVEQDASLSRATIVRLKPHAQVTTHVDSGSYYRIRDRYHFVVQSAAGSELTSGGETVIMHVGEMWWFDNKQFHAACNRSAEWRVHYIFDLLPNIMEKCAYDPLPCGVAG